LFERRGGAGKMAFELTNELLNIVVSAISKNVLSGSAFFLLVNLFIFLKYFVTRNL
jgi:hypothetical protein